MYVGRVGIAEFILIMDLLKFATNIGLIKRIKRSGWLRYLPADHVESVADHSCRMALLTLALR